MEIVQFNRVYSVRFHDSRAVISRSSRAWPEQRRIIADLSLEGWLATQRAVSDETIAAPAGWTGGWLSPRPLEFRDFLTAFAAYTDGLDDWSDSAILISRIRLSPSEQGTIIDELRTWTGTVAEWIRYNPDRGSRSTIYKLAKKARSQGLDSEMVTMIGSGYE